jgi:hypothetical protein
MNLTQHSRVSTPLDNVQTSTDHISESLNDNHLEVSARLELIQNQLNEHSKALATLRPEYENALQVAQAQIFHCIANQPRIRRPQIPASRKRISTRILPRSTHRLRPEYWSSQDSTSQTQQLFIFLEKSLGFLRKFDRCPGQ